MKVLVTGATGGLGRTACEYLLAQGIPVHGIGRNVGRVADLLKRGLQFTEMDLAWADEAALARRFKDVDAVWHCAALSAPWGAMGDFYNSNVVATRKVLSAALAQGVKRFIHVSTPALYFNFEHRLNVPESYLSPRLVNSYARTKHQAELEVENAVATSGGALQAVVLRPRALFGPNDQVLIPRLLRAAREHGGRLPLPNGGHTLLDLTYLENVVDAMWLATTAQGLSPCEVLNISNGEPVVLSDVLRSLSRQLGEPFTLRALPYPVMKAAASLMELKAAVTGKEPALTRYSVGALAFDMTLDISKARARLGYSPRVGVAEGLARTVAALRSRKEA